MGEIKPQSSQNSSHKCQPMHFSLVNRLLGPLCQFPITAEQISPNLVASNNTNLLSYNLGGQKFEMGVPGLKSQCQQDSISLWWLSERRFLLSEFLGFWPPSSSKPAMAGRVFPIVNHSDIDSPASLFFC